MAHTQSAQVIARLNDAFRSTFVGGSVSVTVGVRALGAEFEAVAVKSVQVFDAFTPDNDPYAEHDFGAMTVGGHKLFWKIDYYDQNLEFASPDPTDPGLTHRVLTIMLAEEY